jgi:O-antigen ligase/tetratricopeptide (TPR) repeat protein
VTAAPTESAPALGVAPPLTPARGTIRRRIPAGAAAARSHGLWLSTLLLASLLCLVTFYANGGLEAESMTETEIALTLLSGLILAFAALRLPADIRAHGLWPTLLLLGLTALTAVSIVWSVQPDGSWHDAGRMLAYTSVFAAAVALARLAPERWPAILGGIVIASVVVCAYALLTKALPDHFPEANRYARLYEPYGYWNALGLTAAIGAVCCMWLGARRSGHAFLSALAYPAMGLLLATLMLAYSRGALLALAAGLVLWFCLVPLRLRGAAVLLAGALGAGAVTAWDFHDHALSSEGVAIAESTSAGHELGALLIAMVLVLVIVGVAIVFVTGRRAPVAATRQRAGAALMVAIAVAILAFAGALAASQRGFTGTISHAYDSLTDTNAKVPNTPGRLTAIASVRAQYWDEALKVFDDHPIVGSGAQGYELARLRYRTGPLPVKHAHGYVVQTLADFGLVGLALSVVLLLAWMAAAGRSTHPFNRRWRSWAEVRAHRMPAWKRLPAGDEISLYSPERIGLLSMACVVVVFGAHSLIDWTWYVPGNACVALVCAGWLAGRGPLGAAQDSGLQGATRRPKHLSTRPGSVRLLLAGVAIVAALLSAWSQWQPQRSEEAREEALALLARDPRGALRAADTAVSRDPLSAEALFTLAQVQEVASGRQAALETLRKAVRMQPSNPQTWLTLGRFQLNSDPRSALGELRASIYLDPASISPEAIARGDREAIAIYNEYVQALRATAALGTKPTSTATNTTAGANAQQKAISPSPGKAGTTPSSASAQPSQAAAGAQTSARRRRALQILKRFQSRTRKAAH